MKVKPVIPRLLASQDVESSISYYLNDDATQATLGFIDALERVYKQISLHSASGYFCHSHELDLPGLRSCRLQRYPYPVFYVEQGERIDVWRVLHEMRDLPVWLQKTTLFKYNKHRY